MKNRKAKKSRISLSVLCLFIFGIAGILYAPEAQANLSIKANHDHIKINFLYHGSSVSVRGESDPGTDLIIKISSPEGHQTLRKKGKAGGVLWMNVGALTFEHSSNLYFLRSSRSIDAILSQEEADKYVIGYRSMFNHIAITPVDNEEDKATWFNEFVSFKKNAGLYNVSAGDIELTEVNGKQNYYVLMDWPYKAPPGDYTVTVYAVKDNKVVEKAEAPVLVEQVGIVKTLFDMANRRGALYGLLSILAALGAGFGVGMVFRKGGGAH